MYLTLLQTHYSLSNQIIKEHLFFSMADKVSLFSDLEPIILAHQKVSPVTTYLIPAELQVPHVTIMKYLGEDKYIDLIEKNIGKAFNKW